MAEIRLLNTTDAPLHWAAYTPATFGHGAGVAHGTLAAKAGTTIAQAGPLVVCFGAGTGIENVQTAATAVDGDWLLVRAFQGGGASLWSEVNR